ncbi:pyridoxal phosphate-dependent aminotransferase [Acinetobacter populi]|uniref:Aminotransferase n=1 Tax=Acinetobacter populi TaxID=1582270 RepID=A0A1Z9Z1Y9_9GAMM|nr:pyridoxal phosphate-dependent aminotransferase [Acinetobacter populi]OUY08442.1 aspartate aminotransferase [Acinetobacter populi]
MNIANYTIQEWLFNEAQGKFKYDLAESGVQFQHVKNLEINPDWELDYSLDRGNNNLRKVVKSQYNTYEKLLHSIITHGAQEALYIFYRSFLKDNDHVVATSPGWQQAWEVPKSMNCKVTLLEWSSNQNFPIEKLRESISSKTKLLILNSPCNPTGKILSKREWEEIISICNSKNIFIVNDEEYLLDLSDSIINKYDQSLSVSSLSKIYGLPALRLGWAVSRNKKIIEEMINYKRYTTVSNSLLLEKIAENILLEKETHINRYYAYIDAGRPYLDKFSILTRDYLELSTPQKTPFAWFNTKKSINSSSLARELLEKHKLLVMPAEVFGTQNGLRLTYARDKELLCLCLNMILETLGINERL